MNCGTSTHHGILLSKKKEQTIDTCKNLAESPVKYDKQKKNPKRLHIV